MRDSIFRYQCIPYLFNGRGFDGADCYGIIVLWFKHELGIDLSDPGAVYDSHTKVKNSRLILDNLDEWIEISQSEIRPNDVLSICFGSKTPNHCGLVTDKNEFLQMQEGPGCHIAKIHKWQHRIYRFYRHRKLT